MGALIRTSLSRLLAAHDAEEPTDESATTEALTSGWPSQPNKTHHRRVRSHGRVLRGPRRVLQLVLPGLWCRDMLRHVPRGLRDAGCHARTRQLLRLLLPLTGAAVAQHGCAVRAAAVEFLLWGTTSRRHRASDAASRFDSAAEVSATSRVTQGKCGLTL